MAYAATAHVQFGPATTPAPAAKAPERVRNVWDGDGVVDDLRRLALAGHSATIIARNLNEKHAINPPITRCAVIGKCSRAGISLKVKPASGLRETRKPKEPRLAVVRSQTARHRSPSEALLALPSSVPPGGIGLTKTHRDNLIIAAREHDRWHQSLVDREQRLDEAACRDLDESTVPAALPYPPTSRNMWPETPPKTFAELAIPSECSYITARSEGGDSHYCGAETSDGRMCRWHKRLCYMPSRP